MSQSRLAEEITASVPNPGPEDAFAAEDRQTRTLVRDLHQARPVIYWIDLLATSAVGWAAFAMACRLPSFSPAMLASVAIAVVALYRGLCFIHEISHLNPRAVPHFETVWNILLGYPLLMPSFVYCGVHQSHHKLSTYGTRGDPEYMPFSQSSRMTVVFALESFFIPVALLVRFLLLSPVGLVFPAFQKWLVVHASSLTMNIAYRREATSLLMRAVRWQSAGLWLLWMAMIALAAARIIPSRIFAVWFAVSALISFVNTLRTLGAHAYESSGEPLDRQGQLMDSIDTPGAPWTELWAPVGLRYHALHHYFPGIPYHNLRKAHRRLVSELPPSSAYRQALSPGLWSSLGQLYRRGLGRNLPQDRIQD